MPSPSYQRFLSSLAARAAAHPPLGAWMPPVRPGVIPLHAGYPFPQAIPQEELLAAARAAAAAEGDRPFQYAGSRAAAALPDLLRRHAAALGIERAVDRLLVTAGAIQAIHLAAVALLDPGDVVAVEGPTYMEALEIFRNRGAEIVAYPVDAGGLDTGVLAEDLARRRAAGRPLPRLLYTVPTFHNPTGTTLTLERRRHLLELAAEYDFLILEDGAYAELHWVPPPPPLKALDTEGRVIFLGSLSKVVAPGLRVGWAVGPEPVIRHMALFKHDIDSAFAQAAVARFLEDNDLQSRVRMLRQQYRERCRLLSALLARELPPGCTWHEPGGGFFIWVRVPPEVDTAALLPAAIAAGVSYLPGIHFWAGGEGGEAGRHCLRLSFSYVTPEEMRTGVQILGRLLATR